MNPNAHATGVPGAPSSRSAGLQPAAGCPVSTPSNLLDAPFPHVPTAECNSAPRAGLQPAARRLVSTPSKRLDTRPTLHPLRTSSPRPAQNGARACCPQHAAPPVSVGRSQFINRDDVNWADGHGQLVVINHHHRLGRHQNKVPMRHFEAPAIREAERKGNESVFQTLFELVNHDVSVRAVMTAGKRSCRPIQREWPASGVRAYDRSAFDRDALTRPDFV